jgi:hypothetical protein
LDAIKNYDIYFIDPPWGGKKYINEKKMMLELSGKKIYDIINDIMLTKYKGIFVKVPRNFDFELFNEKIKNKNITVHKMMKNKNLISYYIIELRSNFV